MMELYTNNFRPLLNFFPKQVLASPHKESGYAERSSYHAITECRFIRYNSSERISIIAIDIDTHQDGGVWLDHGLPQPTWTVWTDRGVQLAWALNKPIYGTNKDGIKYAEDVQRKIAYALDADIDALGLIRIFRNPATNRSHITNSRVDLYNFDHLPKPPEHWGKKQERRVHKTLFGGNTTDTSDFGTMKEGDGRNNALFDRLRFWAYDEADAGTYEEFELAKRGFSLNQKFAEPMSYKEVDTIIASIDYFIENKYKKEGYMANTTHEQRKEFASKNGKKGGATTAKLRKAEARGRILATLNQFEMFEIKITVSAIAKKAKSDKGTVSTYLKELGYSNKGGSIGWKK